MHFTVSVVIPARNAERFIDRTLRSALKQSWRALEVIVIDDGSTDRTAAIADGFAHSDSRVRLIRTPNRGVAHARNRGIEAARGSFVAFLDADDIWHPTKIEEQLRAMRPHADDPDWAAVYALHCRIDEDDRVTGLSETEVSDGFIFARQLVRRFVGNGSSLLVRRDAALEVGGFDPSYAEAGMGGTEDLDFELRLAARYRFAAVRRFLVGYRHYPGNMSSHHVPMARGIVETLRRHSRAEDLAPEVRRLAMAAAHHSAFVHFLAERDVAAAGRSMLEGMRNDPAFAIENARHLVGAVLRRMRARIGVPSEDRPYPTRPLLYDRHTTLLTREDERLHRRVFPAERPREGGPGGRPAPAPDAPRLGQNLAELWGISQTEADALLGADGPGGPAADRRYGDGVPA